jgi:predicted O-methyltransferase YrrM
LTVPEDGGLLASVREARRRLAELGSASARTDDDFSVTSLPGADCDALRVILVAEEAETVIEIGLAYGSSALAIGEALVFQRLANPRHLIIDAYQKLFEDVGWEALVAAGLTSICTLLRERSQLVLPRLLTEGWSADAAFVDGSHIFHNVFVDLYYLRELVRPGGLVVLDDCHWPSVATAVRYFERNTGWKPRPMVGPTRLRAFRLPDPRVEPRFEDFRSFGSEL